MVTHSTTIHGVPLGHDTYTVAVKIVIHLDTYLPIPIGDEILYVKDTINTKVA